MKPLIVAVGLVCIVSASVGAQGRLERPAPAGGGDLFLSASPDLCSVKDAELLVRRHVPWEGGYKSVFQTPVAAESCQWHLDALIPGHYDAAIRIGPERWISERRIIAMTEVEILGGQSVSAQLSAPGARVEGFVLIGGVPAPAGTQVELTQNKPPQLSWKTEAGADGSYEIALPPSEDLIARVQPPTGICLWSGSVKAAAGSNRIDLEIPPGVIHFDLTPAGQAPSAVLVVIESTGSASFSLAFHRAQRFDLFGAGYGQKRVLIKNLEGQSVLAETVVTLTPEHLVANVTLTIKD